MRYLVTGGLGVIGSLFARKMLDAGHEVTIIDSCEEPRNGWIREQLKGADIWIGRVEQTWCRRFDNYFDTTDLEDIVEPCDVVLHAAASTGIPYSATEPGDDWERNVEGTRALLDVLRKHPRPTVVLSSVKPYRVPNDRALTEEDVLEPDEPYAASKAAQSMICQAYARSYGIPVTVGRMSNLYGPAPCHGPRHGWLTWFAISAAIGRAIEVQGTGNQARDMLHADDVTGAVRAALANMDKCAGQIFNIGGGEENIITVRRAARFLQELSGCQIAIGPARKHDDDRVYVNYQKFRAATGWKPWKGVTDGLREVYTWAHENREALKTIYEGVI